MQDSHRESVLPIALSIASAMPLIANFDAPNATADRSRDQALGQRIVPVMLALNISSMSTLD